MKPCDKCKEKDYCDIHEFIKLHKNKHPWDLDSLLRNHTAAAVIVKATPDELEIECTRFQGSKPTTDYSSLVDTPHREPDDVDMDLKPAGCDGKCSGCKP